MPRPKATTSYDDLFEKIRPAEISLAIAQLQSEIEHRQKKQGTLNVLLKAVSGESSAMATAPAAPQMIAPAKLGRPKKTRIRRSAEDLRKVTDEAIAVIEAGGDAGVTGADIKAKVVGMAKVQSVKVHLMQHGGKGRFTTKGEKVNMRYFGK